MKIFRPQVEAVDWQVGLLPRYDWAIASVGYESRSRHFFGTTVATFGRAEAFVFQKQQLIAFRKNRKAFAALKFKEIEAHDDTQSDSSAVDDLVGRIVGSAARADMAIVIDISSMTRQLIALLCFKLAVAAAERRLEIRCDFVYSRAKFGDLPSLNGPITMNGPVISDLAGWPSTPSVPTGLILGIGYEEDLALGVIEELEAGAVWGFRPENSDARYDDAIASHNRGLFETIPRNRLVQYSVNDPYGLFVAIDQLASLSKSEFRILIIPFGPKIFSLAGCLASLANYPEIGVWRVSAGPNLKPVDRIAEGDIVSLRVCFRSE